MGAPEAREFLMVLSRWGDFAGRSSRREFWIYELVIVLISVLMRMLDGTILSEAALSQLLTFGDVYSLATLVPG